MSAWWLLPSALVASVVCFQFTCFAIALYETLNLPETRHTRLSGTALGAALLGFAVEVAGVLTMLLVWPFGFVPWRRLARLRPGDRPPVVFVPGWWMNRGCLLLLRHRLRRDGWPQAVGFNYRTVYGDLQRAAEQLRETVERACAETGSARVVLIGHSMGGLVCRAYIKNCGGLDRVASVITLGSGHRGSKLCALSLDPMVQDMRPGSSFLEELATDDPIPGKVDFTAIYSSFDDLIIPAANGYYAGVGNIVVEGVGHNGLLWSRRVYDLVRENLEYGSAHEAEVAADAPAGAPTG